MATEMASLIGSENANHGKPSDFCAAGQLEILSFSDRLSEVVTVRFGVITKSNRVHALRCLDWETDDKPLIPSAI